MDRPVATRSVLALVAGLALLAGSGCGERPPNVLIYTVDTLRADSLACYGNERVATPNIDRLAEEGWLQENAWANSSWTRASMASLFTGLHPRHHGVQGRADVLPGSLDTIGDRLRESGYTTAFITANPNAGSVFGFHHGFDEIIEMYRRRKLGYVRSTELIATSERVTERAIEWLERAERPFFLAVLSVDPHSPYAPPERFDRYGGEYSGRANGSLRSLRRRDLDPADRARIRSLYDAEVSFNDASFGALIEYLRARGELDHTLVVFTADHGEEFWEYGRRGHGRSLADPVLHIPLILRAPDGVELPDAPSQEPAELVDVVPTVLDLLGLASPEAGSFDGRSLLDGSDPEPVWSSLHLDGRRLESLRGGDWKLVWDLAEDRLDLFDLSRPAPEAEPADVAKGRAAAELERLRDGLATRLASARGAPGASGPKELPPDVEDALRALGYVE